MKLPFKILCSCVALLLGCTMTRADDDLVFKTINSANGLADNSAQLVTCTHTGRMIISTLGNINFFDGTSFSHANIREDCFYHLPQYRGNYHLYFDSFHHLWVKNTNTVSCVDLMREQFTKNVDSVLVSLGCKDVVQDLFVDKTGDVWMLTDLGLYSVKRKQTYNLLRDRNLQDVEVFDSTMLVTFYDNGEEVAQDLASGNIVHRTKAYDWSMAAEYAMSSVLQAYGDGFFQIRNGENNSILLFFDVRRQEWSVVTEVPYHLNNMALFGDKLYIASSYGYWIYNPKTRELEHEELLKVQNATEPIITNCNALCFDRQGGMWIGTERRGVLYARPANMSFKTYTWDMKEAQDYALKMDSIEQNLYEYNGLKANCMFTDSRGWNWIGTTNGLYLQRSLDAPSVIYNQQKGLSNNVIHSIVEDRKHNIWLATSCGISCIVFNGEQDPIFVNSFNELDNVPIESFSNCKAMLLDDGAIVMQAVDHVVYFHPEDFDVVNVPKPSKLFPKLIQLQMNGTLIEPEKEYDGNVIIDRAFTRAYDIYLNSDQNSLMLAFSALNYFRPLQSFYRVRLVGLDNEWKVFSYYDGNGYVDKEGRLHLPLIGLKPGEYTLEVQASMFPDMFDGTPFTWNIHVNQSWWRARGIYFVLGGIVLLLLIANFVIYMRNTRMRVRRNAEEGDVVKKIVSFVDRCDEFASEVLSPRQEGADNSLNDQRMKLSPEFIEMMLKLMPVVHNQPRGLSIRKLSDAAGVDVAKFYEMVTSNIYKSPHDLARIQRLRKAADMLRTTQKSIEEVANECGFYTPNYFIGNFFHNYKQLPTEYRAAHQG